MTRRRLLALIAVLLAAHVALLLATTATQVPTGLGTFSNWTLGAGADRVDAVDDPVGTPDDDTTYVVTTVSGQRQDYTTAAFSVGASDTVNSFQIIGRFKFVGTAAQMRLNIVSETPTTSEDIDRSVTSAYADYTRTMTTNPFTAAAWTPNQVNKDAGTANRYDQIEIRSIAPNTDIRCTQVYALVDYTVSGGASPKRLLTLGVGEQARLVTPVREILFPQPERRTQVRKATPVGAPAKPWWLRWAA